jgi:transcription antitermination factor NusA-like protein
LLFDLVSPVKPTKLIIKKEGKWEIIVPQKKASLLLQHEGKLLKKISEYLEVNIHVIILEEIEKDETTLADKGKILQEVGSYKNIEVQIMEEIEK